MEKISTTNAPAAIGPYSQGMILGNMVFSSGQIPVVPATGEVAGDTIEKQAEQSCKNVAAVLEAAGSSMEKVVKNFVRVCFLRPKQRPYKTNNFYVALERQDHLDKEVHRIVYGKRRLASPPVGKKSRTAGKARPTATQQKTVPR